MTKTLITPHGTYAITTTDGVTQGLLVGRLHAGTAQIRVNGLVFGYPPCCIAAFCRDVERGGFPALDRGLEGMDWVPCETCHEAASGASDEGL